MAAETQMACGRIVAAYSPTRAMRVRRQRDRPKKLAASFVLRAASGFVMVTDWFACAITESGNGSARQRSRVLAGKHAARSSQLFPENIEHSTLNVECRSDL